MVSLLWCVCLAQLECIVHIGGVCLGRYFGNELLEEEYEQRYMGTREWVIHDAYAFDIEFQQNDGTVQNMVIDGYDYDKEHPLLRVNDCRRDLTQPKCTPDDRKHQNSVFIKVSLFFFSVCLQLQKLFVLLWSYNRLQ